MTAGPPTEARLALQVLEEAGLLVRSEDEEPAFVFRHNLMQVTAYSLLLRRQRQQIHGSVGAVLEQLSPEPDRELALQMGEHFHQAGDPLRAVRYFAQAADASSRVHALVEAEALFARASALLEASTAESGSDVDGKAPMVQRLAEGRAHCLRLLGRHPEALDVYRGLENWGNAAGAQAVVLAAWLEQATLHSTPTSVHDPAKAEELNLRALHLAESAGDRGTESRALWNLMLLRTYSGRPQEAVEAGERALALARTLGLEEMVAFLSNDIHRAYLALGVLAKARGALSQAEPYWRRSENLPMLCDNLASAAQLEFLTGRIQEAEGLAREAHATSLRIENLWGQAHSLFALGLVELERGNLGAAILTLSASRAASLDSGAAIGYILTPVPLAWARQWTGESQQAMDLLDQAALAAEDQVPFLAPGPRAARTRLRLEQDPTGLEGSDDREGVDSPAAHAFARMYLPVSCEVPLAKLELLLADGRYMEAMDFGLQQLSELRQMGILISQVDFACRTSLAAAHVGQEASSGDLLAEAHALARELGSLRGLWEVYVIAQRIANLKGSRFPAGSRQEAQALVTRIAETLDSESARSTFLRQPDARAVLDFPA